VTRVATGLNTGSNIGIQFDQPGLAVVRAFDNQRMRRQELTSTQSVLFIECAWRLSDGVRLLASSADLAESEELVYDRVAPLLGSEVSECECKPGFHDLTVVFT